jgi:hypothetical protein
MNVLDGSMAMITLSSLNLIHLQKMVQLLPYELEEQYEKALSRVRKKPP